MILRALYWPIGAGSLFSALVDFLHEGGGDFIGAQTGGLVINVAGDDQLVGVGVVDQGLEDLVDGFLGSRQRSNGSCD